MSLNKHRYILLTALSLPYVTVSVQQVLRRHDSAVTPVNMAVYVALNKHFRQQFTYTLL